jgi:hypothetical protein
MILCHLFSVLHQLTLFLSIIYHSFFFFGQAVENSLEEMKMRMMEAEKQWRDFITPGGQGGKGLSVPFEQYVRGILATGCSARVEWQGQKESCSGGSTRQN